MDGIYAVFFPIEQLIVNSLYSRLGWLFWNLDGASDSCLGRWGAEDGVGVLLDVDGEQDLLQVLKTGKIQSMSDDMILNSEQKRKKKQKEMKEAAYTLALGFMSSASLSRSIT